MANNTNAKKDGANKGSQAPGTSYVDLVQKIRAANDEDRQRFIIVLRELLNAVKGDISKGVSVAEGLVACLSNAGSKAALAELKRIIGGSSSTVDAATIVEAFESMTNKQLQSIAGLLKQYVGAQNDDKTTPENVVNAFQHMSEAQTTAVATVLGDAIKTAATQSVMELEDSTYQTLWSKLSKHLALGYITTLVTHGDVESRSAFKQALEALLQLESTNEDSLNAAVIDYLNKLTPQQWANYIDASEVHVNAPEVDITRIVSALETGTTEQRAIARDVLLKLLNINVSPQQVKNAVDEYLISLTPDQLMVLLPSLSEIVDDQIAGIVEYLRANGAFTCDLTEQTKRMTSIRKVQQE
jgi:hypothetical protein